MRLKTRVSKLMDRLTMAATSEGWRKRGVSRSGRNDSPPGAFIARLPLEERTLLQELKSEDVQDVASRNLP